MPPVSGPSASISDVYIHILVLCMPDCTGVLPFGQHLAGVQENPSRHRRVFVIRSQHSLPCREDQKLLPSRRVKRQMAQLAPPFVPARAARPGPGAPCRRAEISAMSYHAAGLRVAALRRSGFTVFKAPSMRFRRQLCRNVYQAASCKKQRANNEHGHAAVVDDWTLACCTYKQFVMRQHATIREFLKAVRRICKSAGVLAPAIPPPPSPSATPLALW